MSNWVANNRPLDWTCAGPTPDAIAFHRGLPGYEPTPLVELPQLARELGVGKVLAKDESGRLGLPAFKALGASWAIYKALQQRNATGQMTIVTATDGNHGRAVAKFAKQMGHKARIVIPPGVHPSAVQAIVDEGAEVSQIVGSYDDAVAEAARLAEAPNCVLVQDTAWEGYEEVPRWIVEGYATMFAEIDEQLGALGRPDLVVVPVGVGSLLQAALSHYRCKRAAPGTHVLSVEPDNAACVVASLRVGAPVSVPTDVTIMAGLNCGTPSSLAWPYMQNGLDAAVSISDRDDAQAARDLAKLGVAAGPCGAAGLAALRFALSGPESAAHRQQLGLDANSIVVLLITEGSAANPAPEVE